MKFKQIDNFESLNKLTHWLLIWKEKKRKEKTKYPKITPKTCKFPHADQASLCTYFHTQFFLFCTFPTSFSWSWLLIHTCKSLTRLCSLKNRICGMRCSKCTSVLESLWSVQRCCSKEFDVIGRVGLLLIRWLLIFICWPGEVILMLVHGFRRSFMDRGWITLY